MRYRDLMTRGFNELVPNFSADIPKFGEMFTQPGKEDFVNTHILRQCFTARGIFDDSLRHGRLGLDSRSAECRDLDNAQTRR